MPHDTFGAFVVMALTHPDEAGPRLVRVDLNEQAYAVLRERLVARDFAPGERLSLQGLADELGVSRSPVHQALTRLASEGLVTTSRRGYHVRPVTAELVRDTHDARLALELFAVEQAAGHLTAAQLDTLRALLEATLTPVEGERLLDKKAYLDANRAFHEAIVDLHGNAVISEIYRRLNIYPLIERAVMDPSFSSAGDSTAEHTEIVAALAAGDAARAARAVRANVETGKRLTLDALERAGGVL